MVVLSIDTTNNFTVGDQVETTEAYRDLIDGLNEKYRNLHYPAYVSGVIESIVRMPVSGSYHIFISGWEMPIGVRYVQKIIA